MASFIVLGNTAIDITVRSHRRLDTASDSWTDGNVQFLDDQPSPVLGGNGAAAAYVLGKQGHAVTLVTALGEDAYGDWARGWLAEASVQIVVDAPTATAVNVVTVDDAGGRTSSYYTGAKVPWDLAMGLEADWLYASGYGQVDAGDLALLLDVFADARERDVQVAFDPGPWFSRDPHREALRDTIRRTQTLLGTEDELGFLAGENDVDAILDGLLAAGPATVAVKRGARGAVAATVSDRHTAEVDPVEGSHSVGAGDTFNGAFIGVRANGETVDRALAEAVRLARLTVAAGRGVMGAFDAG